MSSQILLVWVCANDSMSAKSLRKGSVLARVSIILAWSCMNSFKVLNVVAQIFRTCNSWGKSHLIWWMFFSWVPPPPSKVAWKSSYISTGCFLCFVICFQKTCHVQRPNRNGDSPRMSLIQSWELSLYKYCMYKLPTDFWCRPWDIQQLRHGIFVRPTAATKVINSAGGQRGESLFRDVQNAKNSGKWSETTGIHKNGWNFAWQIPRVCSNERFCIGELFDILRWKCNCLCPSIVHHDW